MLGACERIDPNHTLLAVWAHPDDEAYLAAGLIARTAAAGGRVVCAYATLGEAGTPDPDAWPRHRLAARRADELARALSIAGAAPPVVLGFPDGGCDEVDDRDGSTAVAALISELRPDRIVTFGPDGITGHPDHRAVSRWTLQAWRRTRVATGDPELLFAAMDRDFLRRHHELHDSLDLFADGGPVATDDADIALAVALDDAELDRKRRVLAAHASQTDALAAAVGEDTYRRWWSVESFRRPTDAEVARSPGRRAGPGAAGRGGLRWAVRDRRRRRPCGRHRPGDLAHGRSHPPAPGHRPRGPHRHLHRHRRRQRRRQVHLAGGARRDLVAPTAGEVVRRRAPGTALVPTGRPGPRRAPAPAQPPARGRAPPPGPLAGSARRGRRRGAGPARPGGPRARSGSPTCPGASASGRASPAELLGAPDLLLLDEPTSGLDPLRAEEVTNVLRRLVDAGMTVVATSHDREHLVGADHLVALAPGGRLAYAGPPDAAAAAFGLDRVEHLYAALERDAPAAPVEPPPGPPRVVEAPARPSGRRAHQWWALTRRSIEVTTASRLTSAILAGSPALVVAMMVVLFPRHAAGTDTARPARLLDGLLPRSSSG